MNISVMLTEERYQRTIYLNDRPYDVLDIGEGKCSIVIVLDLPEYVANNEAPHVNQRTIIVDVSKIQNHESLKKWTTEEILMEDLRLLFDVFWLDDVEVRSEVDSINISKVQNVVKARNHFRTLLNFEHKA
ncbi:hypothetical protein [Vibrio alfacsensis]|uniref:hypothetical protein n=1 Tax=Vibrio alfacsensis TaxID=1074311 RepID=UPI001BED920A|nr:hypothetical protein [Vibrio alfacsensis]WQE78357.1 hypothetical protein SO574_14495 [Vibrio alfacsensis]BCN26204.1 hypothetical protein VYA_33960 [Vibrio alfacsensis]